jgi:hypothetical protein
VGHVLHSVSMQALQSTLCGWRAKTKGAKAITVPRITVGIPTYNPPMTPYRVQLDNAEPSSREPRASFLLGAEFKIDAGFLYRPVCKCGFHRVEWDGKTWRRFPEM